MMTHATPVVTLLLLAAAVWVARAWARDYRAALAGTPNASALPGATPATARALAVGAVGALVILALETGGEHGLGLSMQQSGITALAGLYSVLGAPVIEEIIFRGYLVVEDRGRAWLSASVVGVSLLFALSHPFLWEWTGEGLILHSGPKAWFSTTAVFTASLWFYTVRFFPSNPRASLLPCFVAHGTRNLGVLAVKYVQGFVGGWW